MPVLPGRMGTASHVPGLRHLHLLLREEATVDREELKEAILTKMVADLICAIDSMDWLNEHKKSQCPECTTAGLAFTLLSVSRDRLTRMLCDRAQGHVARA